MPTLFRLLVPSYQLLSLLPCGNAGSTTVAFTSLLRTTYFSGRSLSAQKQPLTIRDKHASSLVAKAVVDVSGIPTADTISDPAYIEAVPWIRHFDVPVPKSTSPSGTASVSYIYWKAKNTGSMKPASLPILLIPGFDSSCLEFRRLGPKLAAEGINVYAVDLLGFGFTQYENIEDFSAQAKVNTLQNFWKALHAKDDDDSYSRNFVVAGASLGGAAAIEFAAAAAANVENGSNIGDNTENPVKGMVLIDAQGFVDGVGPMASLPGPLAKIGIQVLKSVPLRNSANQMSYFDKETYATEDALKIGRLHCLRPGWENALLNYMLSGGFSPSRKVGLCDMPTLVLWGRQDGILNGEEFATKFVAELPNAKLKWIEECGHVPHLEQPAMTAREIAEFLRSEEFDLWGERTTFSTGNFDLSGFTNDIFSWFQKATSSLEASRR